MKYISKDEILELLGEDYDEEIEKYLENGETITEFDKDAFEILVKQVIIGGYDEKDKADSKQVTFVLKNESKINYEDYLQIRGEEMSNFLRQNIKHICQKKNN